MHVGWGTHLYTIMSIAINGKYVYIYIYIYTGQMF